MRNYFIPGIFFVSFLIISAMTSLGYSWDFLCRLHFVGSGQECYVKNRHCSMITESNRIKIRKEERRNGNNSEKV